ncbi:hypothetical protein JWG42_11780 [Desulfoprunum benzoelyticum]|uniref:DUF5666 domain-containing protein n=1 Tax=Desulfoprunum benzoelyticum TaxID=1506996 RepID=A0A840V655_9BACT|nr:hypothetical protein [Desulfoprunum benzoelyticum]MBB5349239.1 hypothetical protein [Desulfoprunum benzoelyticum]MBM9530830.1 hypothetical protein [Desulfoprunum benzoelyticum]
MNLIFSIRRLTVLVAALGLFFLQTAPLAAALYEEDVSTGEYLYLKGMVRKVSATDKSVVLEQVKGPRVTIRVTPDTELEGIGKLEDLQTRQIIKVWYRPEQDGNLGLKILRLPDVGC